MEGYETVEDRFIMKVFSNNSTTTSDRSLNVNGLYWLIKPQYFSGVKISLAVFKNNTGAGRTEGGFNWGEFKKPFKETYMNYTDMSISKALADLPDNVGTLFEYEYSNFEIYKRFKKSKL